MTITYAKTLTFVNSVLRRTETDVNVELQTVLDELSDLYLLIGQDTSQTLSDGSVSFSKPSLCIEVTQITLNDGSYDLRPLIALPGGYKEYLRLIANISTGDRSVPRWRTEHNGVYYVYPTSGGSYTSTIDFYKRHADHADGADDISFGDEFRSCIYWGVTFYVALKYGLSRYFDLWGTKYANEYTKRGMLFKRQPSIVQG